MIKVSDEIIQKMLACIRAEGISVKDQHNKNLLMYDSIKINLFEGVVELYNKNTCIASISLNLRLQPEDTITITNLYGFVDLDLGQGG